MAPDVFIRGRSLRNARLHSGFWLDCVSTVQCEANTALVVELGRRAPVDAIGADDARAATDQRVRDAAIGIAVPAHREHRTAVQDEHWHSRCARNAGWQLACDHAGV